MSQRITSLTAFSGTPASGDLMEWVDISDLTFGATGTNKKMTWASLISNLESGLTLANFTTNLPVTRLDSGNNATASTFWNGGNGATGQWINPYTSTVTLTNKRITKRVVTVTQSATPTINTDNTDVAYITGLAQAITSFTTNLSGTPVNGDTLIIDITDNGTGRAITWGTSFESSGNVTLPSTTVAGVKLTIGFRWNIVTSKWRCDAVS